MPEEGDFPDFPRPEEPPEFPGLLLFPALEPRLGGLGWVTLREFPGEADFPGATFTGGFADLPVIPFAGDFPGLTTFPELPGLAGRPTACLGGPGCLAPANTHFPPL